AAHADLRRIAERLSGTHIEFPAVPGATQDLAGPRIPVVTGIIGFDKAGQDALAHRAALVRAAIEQSEEFAAEIEYGDGAAAHGHQLPLARRNLGNRCDHVLAHSVASLCWSIHWVRATLANAVNPSNQPNCPQGCSAHRHGDA